MQEEHSRFGGPSRPGESGADSADGDKNFQKPNKPEDLGKTNPSPPEGTAESYQEPQQKVDNFSPPEQESKTSGDSSGESFQMPSGEEINAEGQKPPEPPPSSTNITPDEEPEDLFAKPEEKAPEPPKPAEKFETPPPSDQKIDIPSEKKGYGLLWGIVAVLILALLAVAVAINELGIMDLGLEKYYGAIRLEKLWGGLPADSKGALADSAKKMEGKSFNLEGSSKAELTIQTSESSNERAADLSLNPLPASAKVLGVETASTQDIVSEMIKKGLNIQSEVKINAKIENKNKFEIGLATGINTEAQTVLDLLNKDMMLDATIVYDNQNIYVNNSAIKRLLALNKDWLKIKTASTESTGGVKSSKLNEIISGGERTGSEKVNGVSCYVYEVKTNNSAVNSYFSSVYPNLSWVTSNSSIQSVKMYLGKRNHLMYKAEITVNNNVGNTKIKNKLILNFKDIGSSVKITVPSAGQVEEKNWSDVKNVFISATATPAPTDLATPEARDTQRKADLKKIQDALLAYKVKTGKYPVTSGNVEKTKDATSNLKTALVPTYLDSLPLDPLEKYYYGYSSLDGTKCEITSILEVKTDPDGENFNGVWIYKLRGN